MKPQYTTVFVIREVSTGKLVKLGAKCGWISLGERLSDAGQLGEDSE